METRTPTPIVVIGYNRPKSLTRLLSSLSKAKYPSMHIPLIISIDKGDSNQHVVQIANDFHWTYGKKEVIYQEHNLGLRKHVLQCGNMTQKYGSAILLEDDLYVSRYFYDFAEQALQFSSEKSYIGGVSLYNHQYNVHVGANFQALEDGYDNWYFQFASSWGQAYTAKQWSDFMAWYETQDTLKSHENIPRNVTNWSEKSWLKYNIAYLIEKNKYFLYPKTSLTTNFSDKGTHAGEDSTKFQVPLLLKKITEKYIFCDLQNSLAVYDAFFENTTLCKFLNLDATDITIDLYGSKPDYNKKYLLSSKILDYTICRTYGRCLKPMDNNIFLEINGQDFFHYDTSIKNQNIHRYNKFREITYNVKNLSFSNSKHLFIKLLKNRFINLAKKLQR